MTRSAWLLGSPVAHSLSPAMHNAAYREMGLDATYLVAEVLPPALEPALRGLQALGALGCNLTIPLKQVGAGLMDRLEEPARALRAVNTVRFEEGRLVGHNTDAEGWLRSWDAEVGEPLRGRRVILLGAGGAARAILWAVALRDADEILVLNRTPERAERMLEELDLPGARPGTFDLCEGCVVVNATPAGMQPGESPVEWPEVLPPGVVACDLLYKHPTRFLEEARARGARTLGGLGMLLHQAAAAIELWTGQPAPVDVMRQAVS